MNVVLGMYLKRNHSDAMQAARDAAAADAPGMLLLSACAKGGVGVTEPVHTVHEPIASAKADPDPKPALCVSKRKCNGTRIVYDAVYSDTEQEYRDARLWESL